QTEKATPHPSLLHEFRAVGISNRWRSRWLDAAASVFPRTAPRQRPAAADHPPGAPLWFRRRGPGLAHRVHRVFVRSTALSTADARSHGRKVLLRDRGVDPDWV